MVHTDLPVWLVPALPLAGAAVLLLTGKRWPGRSAGWLATALMAGSFASALIVFLSLVSRSSGDRLLGQHLFDWIQVGRFAVAIDLRLDPLSAVMILTATGV